MEREFVPYNLALALKELGFDEPCLAYFTHNERWCSYHSNDNTTDFLTCKHKDIYPSYSLSPTYSQGFKWFREKHNLRSFVDTRVYNVDSPNQWIYDYQIKMGNGIDTQPFFSGDFDSYEEAELACLIKLIEIVKRK